MRAMGMARPLFLVFIPEGRDCVVDRQKLSSLFEAESVDAIDTETAGLIAHVKGEVAMSYIFDLPDGDDVFRGGVFTLTSIEVANLARFGAALFLDRIAIRHMLDWTAVPVTLVDDSKEILSGGLLVRAFE
jgi:hypothetical protein